MGLFRSTELLGIAEETLQFVLDASADTHPREYMGFLRATEASRLDLDREGQVITDVVVVPGTESNQVSATVNPINQHNDVQSVGSVHSHPNGVLRPSDADLATFSRGQVHIIVGAPYGREDWRTFDSEGHPTDLDVLDVDLPEEEFFDITQEQIDAELAAEDGEFVAEDDEDGGGLFSWFR